MGDSEQHAQSTLFISTEFVKEILFISTIVILTVWFQNRRKTVPNFPDGPRGFPFLGNVNFFRPNSFFKLHEIAKKYGGMFSLQLGDKKVLVLANYSAIKEAFSKHAFQGRPEKGIFSITSKSTGYIDLNGEKWTEQRTFFQKTIQSLELTSSGAEALLQDEIPHLLDNINDRGGKPFRIENLLYCSISSCMWAFMNGRGLDNNDPRIPRIDRSVTAIGTAHASLEFFNHLPLGKLFLRFSPSYKEGVKQQSSLYSFFRKEITHYERSTGMEDDDGQNFVQHYLKEIKKNGETENSTFTRESLVGNLWLHYAAGRDTMGTTLYWCMLILAKFPNIQQRVQRELDDVIGNERMPTWNDRHMMPYTRAVLSEIQRWRTVMPFNLFRSTTEDSKLRGFHIPKGTEVLAMFYSAHHDPQCWKNPEEFQPERFLSEDGKRFLTKEALIPFSFGKRTCPGKAFALIVLFVYFTSILQKFRIKSTEDENIDLDGQKRITYAPKSQNLAFELRKSCKTMKRYEEISVVS